MDQYPAYAPETPPPAPGPRPFSEIPSLWLKVFNMDEAFFAAELPRASTNNVLLAVLIVAIVVAIPTIVVSLTADVASAAGVVCGGLIGALVGGFIGFYLSAGILFLGARIFGGTGEFGRQTYLQSLYLVPIGVVSALVALIPVAGPYISLGILIYNLLLTVRALKVAHNLTTGRAIGAVVVPIVVLALLAICVITVMALLGGAVGNIFSTIIDNIESAP